MYVHGFYFNLSLHCKRKISGVQHFVWNYCDLGLLVGNHWKVFLSIVKKYCFPAFELQKKWSSALCLKLSWKECICNFQSLIKVKLYKSWKLFPNLIVTEFHVKIDFRSGNFQRQIENESHSRELFVEILSMIFKSHFARHWISYQNWLWVMKFSTSNRKWISFS